MTSSLKEFQCMFRIKFNLNSLQNEYFKFLLFEKLMEWHHSVTYLLNDPHICKAHSFPWVAEFFHCRRISIFPRNFAQVENSAAISTIFDLVTYFYHGKYQTKLLKAVGLTNRQYCNMAQS